MAFRQTSGRGPSARGKVWGRTTPLARFNPAVALGLLLILVLLAGGGSRADIMSLPLLRPAAIGFLFLGLAKVQREHLARHRFLLIWSGAALLLVLLQLVPLPPSLWQALPGRDIVAAVDHSIGNDSAWRPLTMTPMATRNAFWSLSVPLACLVLAIQLDREALGKMVLLILLVGVLDYALAAMQILGDPDGSLYFYRVTNNGSAVGLFANRNHHALFLACLLPMLAYWARARAATRGISPADARRAQWIALAGAALILPLILITGSRAGLALGLAALALCPLVMLPFPQADRTAARQWRLAGLAAAFLALVAALTLMAGRGTALDRLFESNAIADARVRILPTLSHMVHIYNPWGTGFGSFEKLFMIHEPEALLAPTYMNHAHNDWIELLLTGGIPGLALALILASWVFHRLITQSFSSALPVQTRRLGRLGGALMILAALASATDYPLRVPSLGCLAMLALVWISQLREDASAPAAPRD